MKESAEMYLKDIYLLYINNGSVRAVDIAKDLKYSKPSVSRGIYLLKKNGLIKVNSDGIIEFTKKGIAEAKNIYMKCNIISEFLYKTIKLSKKEACRNACRMEHVVTDTCIDKIKTYLKEN